MMVLVDIQATRQVVRRAQSDGKRVGLVPTMGALHEGHASLIRTAREQCDFVVVSIFVNPSQFGPGEDLDSYPRTMDADRSACESLGVDLVFAPSVPSMYAVDALTTVHVACLTDGLCGSYRPGHFDGVTTIVLKLFCAIPCDLAYFGEKDYQQLVVIRRMVGDLNLPIEIVACPTVREEDGLALSSRNARLSADERRQASSLHRALITAAERIGGGQTDGVTITNRIRKELQAAGPLSIDYVDIVDADSLVPLSVVDRPARICLAVRIGSCRLIDNVAVDAPG